MAAPSRFEQYMLELINRARLDPEAEAGRQGIDLNEGLAPGTLDGSAKQPLAMNATIIDAARDHSQWMLDTDTFSHTGAGGSNAMERMEDAGYSFTAPYAWGENISRRGTTGSIDFLAFWESAHDGLFKSSGHRENILNEGFREIGVGGRDGTFVSGGTAFNTLMVTQNFGRSGAPFFVTGTAFSDGDGDRFYDVGEGTGGIAVSVAGGGSTATWASGGYAIAVSPGTYNVTFSGGPFATAKTQQVTVGSANVKLDPIGTDTLASSASLDLGSDFRHLDLLGIADVDGTGSGLANTIRGNAGANVWQAEAAQTH